MVLSGIRRLAFSTLICCSFSMFGGMGLGPCSVMLLVGTGHSEKENCASKYCLANCGGTLHVQGSDPQLGCQVPEGPCSVACHDG